MSATMAISMFFVLLCAFTSGVLSASSFEALQRGEPWRANAILAALNASAAVFNVLVAS